METPLIHYDRFLGLHPQWRQILLDALRGNPAQFREQVLLQGSQRPSLAVTLQTVHAFAHCGQQVYVVGPKYQRMFTDTPCDHIPDVFFKLPHNCFYIALPECEQQVWEYEFGFHTVAGLYVYKATENDILFVIWGKENDKAKVAGDDTLLWIRIEPDKTPAIECEDGVRVLNIDQHIENILQHKENEVSDPGMETPDEMRATQTANAKIILRIAINTILHLNSEGADTERDTSLRDRKKAKAKDIQRKLSRKKVRDRSRRKALDKLNSMSEAIIIWLGKTTENDPRVRVPRKRDRTGGGATWLARKGHRHHYWMGKRRINSDGKRVGESLVLKWVAPVYRMPGDPDIRTREHRFVGEKEDYK